MSPTLVIACWPFEEIKQWFPTAPSQFHHLGESEGASLRPGRLFLEVQKTITDFLLQNRDATVALGGLDQLLLYNGVAQVERCLRRLQEVVSQTEGELRIAVRPTAVVETDLAILRAI